MAYGYFPTYQPYPYNGQYQQYQQQPQQQPTQNGGFISVRSIEEAFSWPVAPGNSIMFKDENSPYVYTKTRGFSQLDQPIFEKYRLVKEEEGQNIAQKPPQAPEKGVEDEIASLWEEVRLLQSEVQQLREKPKRRKEGTDGRPDATVQRVHEESLPDAQ